VEDVVAAACYLADAAGVTGTTLVVDGGQHLVPSPRDIMFLTGPRSGRRRLVLIASILVS
jgi:hypothetical protein